MHSTSSFHRWWTMVLSPARFSQQSRLRVASPSPPRIRRIDYYGVMHPPSLRLLVPLLWMCMASGVVVWSVALSYRMSLDPDRNLRRGRRQAIMAAQVKLLPRVAYLQGVWEEGQVHNHHRARSIRYPLLGRRSRQSQQSDPTRWYSDRDYSSQDFPSLERRIWPQHELANHQMCVPKHDWQSHFDPVCNVVHEQSWYDELVESRLDLISSKGFWRDAWKHQSGNDTAATTVWRTFKLEHNMEEAFFENSRVDALAMERLTASPYIINVHGFCGMTVITEFAGMELSDVAQKLSSVERLDLATKVAKGLSDLHAIDMAHNDLNLANLRMTEDGRPVLNDFNIAVLLMKHNVTGETCPFASRFPNPQWRSPEEQVYSQHETDTDPPIVTEKIDIYALGNVLYRLAVGSSPWKQPGAIKLTPEEKLHVAKLKRTNGTKPEVPEFIATDDPAIQIMLQAMDQTYRFDPQTRPSASEVFKLLNDGLNTIQVINS